MGLYQSEWFRNKRQNDPAWYDAFKADKLRRAKERRADPKRYLSVAVPALKSRAKKLGVEFNLTADDILMPEVCPITSLPFVFGRGMHKQSPSFDRVDPKRGYVKGNVRVISRQANAMKQDCVDPVAFERLAAYIRGEI